MNLIHTNSQGQVRLTFSGAFRFNDIHRGSDVPRVLRPPLKMSAYLETLATSSTSTGCDGEVDDIEDCMSGVKLPSPSDRIRVENKILPKALRRKPSSSTTSPVAIGDSFIPGTQSIFIKTWGCSHNNSDGEYMAGLLGASGYTITGTNQPISTHGDIVLL